ncbi:hypothetical protein FACS1894187_22990 [Synergistales bacterium]|nr:hypothetical protein FACS1894187_22990 [Synergistales bacterium]
MSEVYFIDARLKVNNETVSFERRGLEHIEALACQTDIAVGVQFLCEHIGGKYFRSPLKTPLQIKRKNAVI